MCAARYRAVERIRFDHVGLGAIEDDLCVTTEGVLDDLSDVNDMCGTKLVCELRSGTLKIICV
jgi:hypothetical protein